MGIPYRWAPWATAVPLSNTHSPNAASYGCTQKVADLHPPLDGGGTVRAVLHVVLVGHRDDVLGLSGRRGGRSVGEVARLGCFEDPAFAGAGVRQTGAGAASGAGSAQHLRRASGVPVPGGARRKNRVCRYGRGTGAGFPG